MLAMLELYSILLERSLVNTEQYCKYAFMRSVIGFFLTLHNDVKGCVEIFTKSEPKGLLINGVEIINLLVAKHYMLESTSTSNCY